ncbi:hypothetical protein LCGC14_0566760 [marine sediment metagenome]|uniref:Uncharacterized protein n=1 Tax=marine sediment metagenome TaxID=412755 RepID=A0A0F9RQI5_9ZZZZ
MSFHEYHLAEKVSKIRARKEKYYWGVNNLKLNKIKKILQEEIKNECRKGPCNNVPRGKN